ncbi:MAG TPA: DNA polymerase III subunit beta [Rhodocyclaceae bacterium]|nr:DNA polymerase III subunit beta [Rhodocyclaceae bacterium]
MLLYKGPRDQILTPLQSVCGIVEKRHTLPILSNVLMEKDGERLTMLATDIEIQIRTSTTAVGIEKTALTVGARKLQDILRSLPESAEVSLALDDKRLQLKAGKSRFNLQTLPAEDFPRMLTADGQTARISMSQKQFKHLLALVQYSMAQQDIRYYLNGLLLVTNGAEMRVVATDGHRLAFASEALNDNLPRIEVILPRKTVLELSRQLADNDEPLEISLSPTQAQFRFGNIELVSKLIDGKFPDYERVIPQQHTKVLQLPRDVLLHSLMRAAILTNEKFRGVRLVLNDGSLKILSTNAEQEEAQEEIEVPYTGENLDVGFNVTYLLDVLNNIAVDTIECRLADASSSALFMLPGNDRFKYVVMPMRI